MSAESRKENVKGEKSSRRAFLKAATMAGGAVGIIGFPAVMRVSAAEPVRIRMQTAWNAGDFAYSGVVRFCREVGEITNGRLIIEAFPADSIVRTFEMFDAVKEGVLDAMHCFDAYWPGKAPACAFLSSYPFGMDQPAQWETWYESLGGKQIAREAYGQHNMYYLGPIQQDDSLIHSRIPIRSFEDFKGKRIRLPAGMPADIHKAAGVVTLLLPRTEVYPALEAGIIDAADYLGAAANYAAGLGEICKYIIMGPPSMPCFHQPVDLMSIEVNTGTWKKIPSELQRLFEIAVKNHSWEQYASIQRADVDAFEKFQKDQKVEAIRLKEEDISNFRRLAPKLWVEWAKKHPLAMKAFKSQFEYMKSVKIGHISEKDMVDPGGKKLVF